MVTTGFERLTKSASLVYKHTLLNGLLITPTAAGDTVALYAGGDSNSGRLLHTFILNDVETQQYDFSRPILMENGLTLVLSAGITQCTVLMTSLEDPLYSDWVKR